MNDGTIVKRSLHFQNEIYSLQIINNTLVRDLNLNISGTRLVFRYKYVP